MWFPFRRDSSKSRISQNKASRKSRDANYRKLATQKVSVETLEDRFLPSFSPITSYTVGLNPQAVAVGDFNGDNHPDLINANYSDSSVSVLLNNGDGTFQNAQTTSTGQYPRSLAVGDFNGDNKLDTVVLSSGAVSLLLGNGDGTFQSPQSINLPDQFPPGYTESTPLTQYPISVAVGDIDGNGKMDLVVTGQTVFTTRSGPGYYGNYYYDSHYNGHINVLMGNGNGTFANANVYLHNDPYPGAVALVNVDGDADLDILVNNYYGASVLKGDGTGNFQSPIQAATSGYGLSSVVTGDLDKDGKLDLVMSSGGYSLSFFKGKGDGTFQFTRNLTVDRYPNSVAVGDINNDGNLDLVAATSFFTCTSYGYYGCYDGYYTGEARVLLGYGDGTFASPQTTTLVNSYLTGIALKDFTGDNLPDVAVTTSDTQVITAVNAGNWVLPPSLRIDDVTVTEGDSGTLNVTFTVTVEHGNGQAISVNYATAGYSYAVAGKDYVAKSGQLNFGANDTTMTITVAINGDLIDEYDEQFVVNLSGATNAEIADGQGLCTIMDNDPPPTISITDASVNEGGNRSSKFITFLVTLSGESEKGVWVNYTTVNGTATTADNDYRSTSSTLYFGAGETSKSISVLVYGDKRREGNETFSIQLSNATNATIGDGTGIGTIVNDDMGGGKGGGKGRK